MDELDRSPQPGSDPPVGPQPPDAAGPSAPNPSDDAAPAAPGDVPDGPPESVPDTDVDPRAAAAASQPPNVSDILAEQSALDQGADGQGKAPYGDAGLRGGTVSVPSSANPLTAQRAQHAAALEAAKKDPDKNTESGGVNLEKSSKSAELAKELANKGLEYGLDKARENPKYGRYVPLMPEGDTLGDKTAHLVGQGANIGLRAWADSYAPGVYDTARNSLLGRVLTSYVLNKSPVGKLLGMFEKSRRFRDGLNAQVKNNGQVSKREKIQIILVASLPLVLPLVAMILVIALVLGVGVSSIEEESQPDEASDRKVAEYFPGDWQYILKAAAFRASLSAEDYSTVPWTILAGLVKTQTDFARYSPYDNIDRDPGRTSKELPVSGGGDGGDSVNVDVSNTRGAGPGPVEGVSGEGSIAVVPGSAGHETPPQGNLSQQLGWFLWALRMHESGGDYQARAGTSQSTACGAYQYIGSTWNNYEGYATACDAPPAIQDKRAKRDIIAKWNQFGKWQQVAAQHFTGSWGNQPERWHECPAACDFNPTVWEYVDGVIGKMRQAADARGGPMQRTSFGTGAGGGVVLPADVRGEEPSDGPGAAPEGIAEAPPTASGVSTRSMDIRNVDTGSSGADGGTGVFAGSCRVSDPDPKIGGEDDQGSGPYLLTPAAAAQMRNGGLDPQDPCASSFFVARELVKTARSVHSDPESPKWKAHGDEKDQENARKYWSKVIETSGIFMDRSASPEGACAVPPPDDPDEPWSISFKIISVWRCEATRIQDLYLVTDGEHEDGEFKYTVQQDRVAAIQTIVNEALSVSYGASEWETEECDNADDEPQGIFPMTEEEAEEAGVTDRCDVEENIAGAAKLVLSVEKTPPKDRPDELGVFQPMIGGWEKLGIAMGTDLDLFALIGPGQNAYEATDECTTVMRTFLNDVAPHATAFNRLTEPPPVETVYSKWRPKLDRLEKTHGLTNPSTDPACRIGSWAPGFNNTVAQIATGLAGENLLYSSNLRGLANYYQGREEANTETPPVVGEDTLVIPRLALRPLKPIGAPVAGDAGEAWNRIGSNAGITLPLEQVAVEYAWFFGGVIPPYDSAGKLIGSLENGGLPDGSGPVQVEVGPDGCPKEAPPNTLREGAAEIGINKLCVDSVAQARTPEAAKAIKWALTHLGIPYSQDHRNEANWADCSSFVSRAYRDSGAIPNLYPQGSNAPVTGPPPVPNIRQASWSQEIPFSQLKPGDLVEPHPGHVAMRLANGYKVHTNQTGDVSKVDRAYSSAFWSGWVNGSNA